MAFDAESLGIEAASEEFSDVHTPVAPVASRPATGLRRASNGRRREVMRTVFLTAFIMFIAAMIGIAGSCDSTIPTLTSF